MADDLTQTISENAQGPAKASGDAGSMEQHPLKPNPARKVWMKPRRSPLLCGRGALISNGHAPMALGPAVSGESGPASNTCPTVSGPAPFKSEWSRRTRAADIPRLFATRANPKWGPTWTTSTQ
jgi:hypothetical protein